MESTLPKSDCLNMGPNIGTPMLLLQAGFLEKGKDQPTTQPLCSKEPRNRWQPPPVGESDSRARCGAGKPGFTRHMKWKRDLSTSHGPWPFWPVKTHKGNFNLPGINPKCVNKKTAGATALKKKKKVTCTGVSSTNIPRVTSTPHNTMCTVSVASQQSGLMLPSLMHLFDQVIQASTHWVLRPGLTQTKPGLPSWALLIHEGKAETAAYVHLSQ